MLRDHYTQVWRRLRGWCRRGLPDDAAQEVFIVLSRKLATSAPAVSGRLARSAVRVAANYRRSWRARHDVADERALAQERESSSFSRAAARPQALRQALDELLERCGRHAQCLVLFELEGLSVPEIAELRTPSRHRRVPAAARESCSSGKQAPARAQRRRRQP